ncbi:MAG: DUF47 domain-containing protein [Oscillospiraceae bacterium]
MAAGRSRSYFERLAELAALCAEAAELLKEGLVHCHPALLPGNQALVEKRVDSAEKQRRELNRLLLREFITPIDREDISLIAARLCEILRAVDGSMCWLPCTAGRTPRPEALQTAGSLCRCCDELAELCRNLQRLKKTAPLVTGVTEANRLAHEGDKVCSKGVQALFGAGLSPALVQAWIGFYGRMAEGFAACSRAAEQIWIVLLKNG